MRALREWRPFQLLGQRAQHVVASDGPKFLLDRLQLFINANICISGAGGTVTPTWGMHEQDLHGRSVADHARAVSPLPPALLVVSAIRPTCQSTEFTMSANRTALSKLALSLPSDLAARVNEWIDRASYTGSIAAMLPRPDERTRLPA